MAACQVSKPREHARTEPSARGVVPLAGMIASGAFDPATVPRHRGQPRTTAALSRDDHMPRLGLHLKNLTTGSLLPGGRKGAGGDLAARPLRWSQRDLPFSR
eukprot:4295832-Heterocapsa_arctica.AAC.1